MIANGNIFSPNSTPTIDPVKVGKSTYMRYLARTAAFPLPNAMRPEALKPGKNVLLECVGLIIRFYSNTRIRPMIFRTKSETIY